jgi:hypothetical protein
MNKFINKLLEQPGLIWLIGTLVGISAISVFTGINIGMLIFGGWTLVSVVSYFMYKY